jgi:cold shock CspA family protein
MRGKVAYFSQKGWGWIAADELEGRVWFHMSAARPLNEYPLEVGREVEFEYEKIDHESWPYRALKLRPI